MLRKFAVSNFKGFKKRIELNLSNPSSFEYNQFAVADGVVKDLIIYGPNGSGKSNLGFAVFDIVDHLTQKNKHLEYYQQYTYAGNADNVLFEYEFVFGGRIAQYVYSKSPSRVLVSEKLVVDGVVLFDRNADEVYFNSDFFTVQDSVADDFGRSVNNVSLVSYLLSSQPLAEDSPLVALDRFVGGMLWFRCLEDRGYIGFDSGSTELDAYIIDNKLIEDFQAFLTSVSGQTFVFRKPNEGEKTLFCMIDGVEVSFNSIVSTGTNSLRLLYYWLTRMCDTSFVFIDEFDAFYHYELSYAVCKRLFELKTQVCLTTHNTSLMSNDLLRPDCYFLINGEQIKPLVQCTNKELRVGHNLEKLYRGNGFEL